VTGDPTQKRCEETALYLCNRAKIESAWDGTHNSLVVVFNNQILFEFFHFRCRLSVSSNAGVEYNHQIRWLLGWDLSRIQSKQDLRNFCMTERRVPPAAANERIRKAPAPELIADKCQWHYATKPALFRAFRNKSIIAIAWRLSSSAT
jgi:hypothetical protein